MNDLNQTTPPSPPKEDDGHINVSLTGAMSLADMANFNTDEVTVLMSRLPAEGTYVLDGQEAGLTQGQAVEGKPPLTRLNIRSEIADWMPVTDDVTEEDILQKIGKTFGFNETLWPSDMAESIGLLKGNFIRIGLPVEGRMGGVEGHDPGWIEGLIGHRFIVTVKHGTDKNGTERAYINWKLYDAGDDEGDLESVDD